MVIWFDILWLNGTDLMVKTYKERRDCLEKVVDIIPTRVSDGGRRAKKATCKFMHPRRSGPAFRGARGEF